MTTLPEPTGAIYDIGYRHYDGPRLGRREAIASIVGAGLRAVFGLGRSGRSKILPWGAVILALMPASNAACQLTIVANRVGEHKQGEIARSEFEKGVGRAIDVVVPFDAKGIAAAVNIGQPITTLKNPAAKAVTTVGDQLCGAPQKQKAASWRRWRHPARIRPARAPGGRSPRVVPWIAECEAPWWKGRRRGCLAVGSPDRSLRAGSQPAIERTGSV